MKSLLTIITFVFLNLNLFGQDNRNEFEKTFVNGLPSNRALSQSEIDKYYPGMTDTISDRRIIGSEIIEVDTKDKYTVSLLQNTGTFNQMFLCTHDHEMNLIDVYYVGKSTMFDASSHVIEYEIIDHVSLVFTLTRWGYSVENQEEPSILHQSNLILRIGDDGRIRSESVDLEKFWENSVRPLIDKDLKKLDQVVNFPLEGEWGYMMELGKDRSNWNRKNFYAHYDQLFDEKVINLLKEQSFRDAEYFNAEILVGIGWKNEDGVTESGIIFRFKKIDGIWKLHLIQGVG